MPSPPLPPRIALPDDPPLARNRWRLKGRRNGLVEDDLLAGGASRAGQAFTNWLCLIAVVLMVALAGTSWQWLKAREQAEAAAKQAAMAWKFGDGMLEDLAQTRDHTAKLEGERETLIRVLGQAERLHTSLRNEFSTWQKKHEEVVASSERALSQLTQYGQTLETSLGATQAQLAETSQTLQQARAASEEQISQLDGQKTKAEADAAALAQQQNALEVAAGALGQKAQNLDSDNGRLQAEVSRLRTEISSLQTENAAEQLRNNELSSEVARQREKIGALEARLQAAERERDMERDKAKH